MKKFLLGLAFTLMFLIPLAPAAKAQVVVRVGPEYHHRYYREHRHYYHHAYYHHRYYYRHGHRYYHEY